MRYNIARPALPCGGANGKMGGVMNYLEKYLTLVWDANHGATKTVFNFDKNYQATDFRMTAKENNHVKSAKQKHNKVIIEYDY